MIKKLMISFVMLQIFMNCSISGVKYCAFENCRPMKMIDTLNSIYIDSVNRQLVDSLGFSVKEIVAYWGEDSEVVLYSRKFESRLPAMWNDTFPNGVFIFVTREFEIRKLIQPIEKRFHRRGI